MSYAIIKNAEIVCFSDKVPEKYFPGEYEDKITENFDEQEIDGEIVKVKIGETMEKICVKEPIDGIDYDEAIKLSEPYDYAFDYAFNDGKVVKTKKQSITRSKEEIARDIGALVQEKNGLIEIGEDISDIEARIASLKEEYKSF